MESIAAMNSLQRFVSNLAEGDRTFYVSGNKVHFTRGQEHFSVDITRASPYDFAHDLISRIVLVNAMASLQRELKREPSLEELADRADEEAYGWAQEAAQRALHMGASDFRKVAAELFPGVAKEAPKEVEEALQEGFHVPENELKMGRMVRWYDDSQDRIMFGRIVNVGAHSVQVNDGKFNTDKTYTVKFDFIMKVSEDAPRGGKHPKVIWTRS